MPVKTTFRGGDGADPRSGLPFSDFNRVAKRTVGTPQQGSLWDMQMAPGEQVMSNPPRAKHLKVVPK